MIMDTKIKDVLRSLATCEHPIQFMFQHCGNGAAMQWCSACGAVRLLDGRDLPPWRRSGCAVAVNEILVEKALQDPANEEAKKAVAALHDD
jgi:hypothetical protein